ncbi:unnamed protein product [Schistosoma turkestanicum]|nr:unnamed protein product [Schistosoma turkestanicum]
MLFAPLGFLIFFNCIILVHSLYSVAFECGKPAIYLNNEFWVTDLTQDCLEDELSILNYCRKVYSGRNITTVVSAPPISVVLSDWCEFAHKQLGKCQNFSNKQHEIKPFICLDTIPMSTLFIPVGCQLSSLDSDRSYVCENYKFWESSTQEACFRRNMKFQSYLPIKPCVKEKDFSSIYFAAAKVVCCEIHDSQFKNSTVSIKPLTNPDDKTDPVSDKLISVSSKLTTTESDVRDSHKVVIDYLSPMNPNPSGLVMSERERYNQAKMALNNDLRKHEKVLEQELSNGESLISPEDWLSEPIKSQLEEDSLVQEFRSKFVKLENESELDRKSLETTHHQRNEAQMLERRKAIQNAWEKAVNIENPNNFTLFETLKRLFQVVEHDRSHYVKRFEHLRNMEQPEAVQQLTSIKKKLVGLDVLLNQSLEKINLHPELTPSLSAYANYLRNNKYGKLEAQSKADLVADVTLPDMVKLPTFQEQASLKAEKVVAKYRHHLEPSYLDKSLTNHLNKDQIKPARRHKLLTNHLFGNNKNKNFSNSHQMKTTTIIPTINSSTDVPMKFMLNTVDYSSSVVSFNENQNTPHIIDNEITENKTTVQFESYQNRSIVTSHADQVVNTSNSSNVNNNNHLTTQPVHMTKTAYILFIVLGIILSLICLFLILRRYFTSIRYNRKGYTMTVVEVDEVIAPKVNSPQFLPVRQNRFRKNTNSSSMTNNYPNDLIQNWQMNGYENPAYQFTTTNKTDRFTHTNHHHHHHGLFHQDNSFDDFEI